MKPVASHYDFTVIGRWRNRDNVAEVVAAIRGAGHSCFSFIENDWSHHKGYKFSTSDENTIEETMRQAEALPIDSLELKEIFDRDLAGLKNSDAVVLALPGGTSSLIESGIAFGLGKKLYAVGEFDKAETLFQIFDEIFSSVDEFKKFLKEEK
ncbi:nucleoside 2-deoxyribosyltransferase domain-containing protein [Candidatus Saccharibacteria bacterium]|nr:nucleoside 2-deoxyribosyltransferase domain-containing protein [Candidatus Saccharibacteria bacterium]